MAENTLDIVLRFLTDKNSLKQAQQAIGSVVSAPLGGAKNAAGNFVGAEALQTAKDLGLSVQQVARQFAGMETMAGRTEQQILADVQAFQQMTSAADQAAQAVNRIDQNTQRTSRNVRGMGIGFSGFLLGMTGMQLQRLGTSMLSPIGAYTKYAGNTSPYSAQYLAAQKSIETSTIRIGQVMASQIAPMLEDAAKVVEQIASWAEANPDLVGGVAKGGALALAGGGAAMAVGQSVAGWSAIKMFIEGMRPGQTANTTALAANTAAITANTGAQGAGAVIKTAPGIVGGAAAMSASTIAAFVAAAVELATIGHNISDYSKGKPMAGQGGITFVNGVPQQIDAVTGALTKLGATAQQTSTKIGAFDPATKAFVEYQKANIDAEKQYEQERADLVKQYGQQRADLEREYEARRSDILKQIADLQSGGGEDVSNYQRQQMQQANDFHLSETRAEQDYYRQRSKLAEDYNIDVQRAEEDHQRKMRQMAAQHNLRMRELGDQNDVMGMLREQQSYEQNRKNAEEDYQVEARRRSEDFARRLAEMEQEFAISRQRRLQDYQQRQMDEANDFAQRRARELAQLQEQLKALDAEHAEELKRLADNQTEKLKQLDTQYAQEKNKRQAAFNDQLRDLGVALYNETNLKEQYWQYQAQALQRYIDQARAMTSNLPGYGTQTNYSGRASGGYASYGLYTLGEEGDEYILTRNTTRALERMIGGRLTQQRVLALAMMGGGSQSVTYNDHRRFDSKLSASDRRMIQQDTRAIFAEVFGG